MKKGLSTSILFMALFCTCLYAKEPVIDYTRYVIPSSAAYLSGSAEIIPGLSKDGPDLCCGFFFNDIPIMPVSGFNRDKAVNETSYRSGFSQSGIVSSPGYFKVHLDRWNIDAEMVAGSHSGLHKYTFSKNVSPQLIIDLSQGGGTMESSLEVIGKNTICGQRKLENDDDILDIFFFIEFSKPIYSIRIDDEGKEGTKALITFKPSIFPLDNTLFATVGTSSVSVDEAKSYVGEDSSFMGTGQVSFAFNRKKSHDAWLKYLSSIEVEGERSLMESFYTAMYHASTDRNLFKPGNLKRFENEVMTEKRIDELLSDTGDNTVWEAAYLYDFIGKPWKTQEALQRIISDWFLQETDWKMAEWFIFTAMGFYPLSREYDDFIFGTPLFKKVVVHTSDDGRFVISATNLSDENRYVSHLTRNSEVYTKIYFKKSDIENNVTFRFTMAPNPGANYGTGEEDVPYDSE